MRKIFTLVLLFIAQLATAQNNYTSGPLYWKNRMPDKAYWQQDVAYTIDASIDETTHIITATESLQYTNNSPDTLQFVYFHLYQNAFIKGSHLHSLEMAQKQRARLGKYEADGLGTEVTNLKVDGQNVSTELDNTILKVFLNKPLLPGGKIVLSMNFKTWYDRGSTRRRMQMYDAWGFKHYNGCQWYPKICVYDRKFGWDTYQHLNKEFYGDFGTFDVSLQFASNYIVEATGALTNRKEVLPEELRKQLDLKNFANKKWNEAPSTIIPYVKGERKTWKYHAENVHDFAFTADPSFRIGTTFWNGIECVAIAQEPHASGWQNGAEYVAKIIKAFSEDIGMYQYPKMVAADASDGMEYPMLTLDGGSDPGYRGLLVHEIAHNWFYGMVGSNETYRAALDEGFTQFLTAYGLRKIEQSDILPAAKPKGWYRQKFAEPASTLDSRVLMTYTYDALRRDDMPLNTHSNDFHNALGHEGGYRSVYYKTASMLYNLQYTLGDSLFLAAMQHYFSQWRFAHPYFEDFRNSIIQYTHTDLNWFFDQWMETTKPIDYRISRVKRISGNDNFAIRLKRYGAMEMPIDLTVTAKDGKTYNYHIPNNWFEKQTQAKVLPKWYGWGKLHETYTANVTIPSGIRSVQIDTTYRLADADLTDNIKPHGLFSKAVKIKFDGGLAPVSNRRYYKLYVRPDIWYNVVDGIKAGIHFEGDYLTFKNRISGSVWWNSHVGQTDEYVVYKSESWYKRYLPYSFVLNYNTPFSSNNPKVELQLNAKVLDGLTYFRGGVNWNPNDQLSTQFYFQSFWRPISYDLDYLLYPNEWSSNKKKPNNSLNISVAKKYRGFDANGVLNILLRAPLLTGYNDGAFNYGYLEMNNLYTKTIGKFELRTRLFGRIGMGKNMPYESALWLAGANPEQLMDNKYTRSKTFVPDDLQGISKYEFNHFQQGGGMNLRGYAGYFVADERDGEVLIGYKGRSGISANVELDFDNGINWHPRIFKWLHTDLYLFGDAGIIELSRYTLPDYWNTTPTKMWSDLRADAGLGMAFTIRNWGVFEKAKPLTLRVDLPFFVNRAPYGNPDYFGLRYVIGINRTF